MPKALTWSDFEVRRSWRLLTLGCSRRNQGQAPKACGHGSRTLFVLFTGHLASVAALLFGSSQHANERCLISDCNGTEIYSVVLI
jgi:hypothetical protein